jgi:hypothetical protein
MGNVLAYRPLAIFPALGPVLPRCSVSARSTDHPLAMRALIELGVTLSLRAASIIVTTSGVLRSASDESAGQNKRDGSLPRRPSTKWGV